ncbi:MAG: hypothetical protein JWM47_3832 [Acidimicrobiales bacterium]|nr:hypothetical protein [Acidimicrobiales bacterium]
MMKPKGQRLVRLFASGTAALGAVLVLTGAPAGAMQPSEPPPPPPCVPYQSCPK